MSDPVVVGDPLAGFTAYRQRMSEHVLAQACKRAPTTVGLGPATPFRHN